MSKNADPKKSDAKNRERFIFCLRKLQLQDSQLVDQFINQVLYMLPSLYGLPKVAALEIIASRATCTPEMFRVLQSKDLLGLIRHRFSYIYTSVIASDYIMTDVEQIGMNPHKLLP